MASKIKTIYACSNCGAQALKWSGRCLECGGWGTLSPETVDTAKSAEKISAVAADIVSLNDIQHEEFGRLQTGISEFDRVLGGGIVPGSLVLLSGEPGIGKSTIAAQAGNAIAERFQESPVVYVSGEESAVQVKSRFDRLNCRSGNIKFIGETDIDKIIQALAKATPSLVIIDSIQTMTTNDLPGEAGGVAQIRAGAAKLLEFAKKGRTAVVVTGHITKDGSIAGPKSLEHIVDVVLHFELEDIHNFRILRAAKNRFGSINEIGIFDMTGIGFNEILNPSAIFMDADAAGSSGSVISCVMEGTRPFFVEVQALVTKTVFGYPQRKSSGFDLNRLQVLIAVLTKRAKMNLSNQDVILNIAGGQKINEPSLDLAVCFAIASSLLNQTLDRRTVVFGEVGLGGEVRKVPRSDNRLNEAAKLGFKLGVVPNSDVKAKGIVLEKIKKVDEIAGVIAKII